MRKIIALSFSVVLLANIVYADYLDERTLGDSDALITIEFYAEYEGPFSGRGYRDTLPDIKNEYIDEGIVK